MTLSPIINIGTGFINQVNDPVIGSLVASPTGLSKFAGQLGKHIWMDDSQVRSNTAAGFFQVFGGAFQYVRLSASAAVPVVGQLLFWDTLANAVDNLYQVTTAESGSTDAAMLRAGICLTPNLTPGNFTFIQTWGPTFVKFRATLTTAGTAGSRAYAAGVGGADLGFADVNEGAGAATVASVSQQIGRFIGVCQEAPSNGGRTRVYVELSRPRG
jgi:hypothetical protein